MWSLLEDDNKTRLGEVVRQSRDDIAQHMIPICVELPEMQDIVRERLSRLGHNERGFVGQQSRHPIIVQSAVDLFCSSRSWDQANSNYQALEPLVNELSQAQIRRILIARDTEGADLPGAHSFGKFCRFVYDSEKIPREELIATLSEQGADYIVRDLQREPGDFPF
jgi:hypothetical protein